MKFQWSASICLMVTALTVHAQEAASASASGASAAGETRIYQQRAADGRIVLTDRPVPGAVTQRTWQTTPEDAAAARQRREDARLDAQAVSARVQRQLDAERQRDLEESVSKAQRAEAEAKADAARARAEADARPAVVYGSDYLPYGVPRPTTPGVRPGFPPPRPVTRPPRVENPMPLWRRPLPTIEQTPPPG